MPITVAMSILIVSTNRKGWSMQQMKDNRELSVEELGTVTGGGIVDTVLSDAEATTDEFLKKFAESSLLFNAFINKPGTQVPTANPE